MGPFLYILEFHRHYSLVDICGIALRVIMPYSVLFEWVGLLCSLGALYSVGEGAWQRFKHHSQLQSENSWLYDHCMANEKLRLHTDACDRVVQLFQTTPLQAVLSPTWSWWQTHLSILSGWQTAAHAFVMQHKHFFLIVWFVLFLTLPRLLVAPWQARLMKRQTERLQMAVPPDNLVLGARGARLRRVGHVCLV